MAVRKDGVKQKGSTLRKLRLLAAPYIVKYQTILLLPVVVSMIEADMYQDRPDSDWTVPGGNRGSGVHGVDRLQHESGRYL
jgi:hypothetical protein